MFDLTTRSKILPQFFPSHWLREAPDLVHESFSSRIEVGYVVRDDSKHNYLMTADLDLIGLNQEAVREVALSNLESLPMPDLHVAQTPGGPEAYLEDLDNFVAVRLLLPRVRRALELELGAHYYIAIPCRDWLFCWSQTQRDDFRQRNVAEAKKVFLEDDHNLTPDILLAIDTGFELFLRQDTEA